MPIRLVLQAIDQAWLLVDNETTYIRAGRGVMVYIAFIKDDGMSEGDTAAIKDEMLQHAVDVLLQTRIFTHFSPERMMTRAQSLAESPTMDILVVPQASLGGKVQKGHSMQFHTLVNKDVGELLYLRFCHLLRLARGVDETTVDTNGQPLDEAARPAMEGWLKYAGRVMSGSFGYRQGLRVYSDGPFTHLIDIPFGVVVKDTQKEGQGDL